MNAATPAAVSSTSPGRHLLSVIVDALQLPAPARTPGDEAAYLELVSRRSLLVPHACRQALASPDGDGVPDAARVLSGAVPGLLTATYQRGPAGQAMSA